MACILNEQPPPDVAARYHKSVTERLEAQVEVKNSGPSRGKGIFATRSFAAGDIIFQERALVSQQDRDNHTQVLNCAQCHRFVGSVELQIAGLLQHVLANGTAARLRAQRKDEQKAEHEQSAAHGAGCSGGSCNQPSGASGSGSGSQAVQNSAAKDEHEDGVEDDESVDEEQDAEYMQRLALLEAYVGEQKVEQLARGAIQLPHSDKIEVPPIVPCLQGCLEVYCSTGCRQQAWQQHHCLLCPGNALPLARVRQHPPAYVAAAESAFAKCSGGSDEDAAVRQVPDECKTLQGGREALAEFYKHAYGTNDVFCLAARLVAGVATDAARIEARQSSRPQEDATPSVDASTQQPASSGQEGTAGGSTEAGAGAQGGSTAALTAAWQRYAVGWRKVWWESVAVPPDVDDEDEFRQQLRDLACDSLTLLEAALPGVAARYPELLSQHTWGSIIGMFELNNLGLAVPSPVEDYFLLIDDLQGSEKSAAQVHSQPWLDALDKWYDTTFQGTGFYALQSCANHSCDPNAATEGVADGRVAIYALRDIPAGEEVTLSYLEEDPDEPMTLKDRHAALQDYGFVCACSRCMSDMAKKKKKVGGKAGMKVGRR